VLRLLSIAFLGLLVLPALAVIFAISVSAHCVSAYASAKSPTDAIPVLVTAVPAPTILNVVASKISRASDKTAIVDLSVLIRIFLSKFS
jgi:hypothetical protein